MEINFPSNLTDMKYGQFAYNFDDWNEAVHSTEIGRIVLCWDDSKDTEAIPSRQVCFLQEVSYGSKGAKYTVYSKHGYLLTYDHAIPIAEEQCPRVFVRDGDDASVGRLIGLMYDGDEKPIRFYVRRLPFDIGAYNIVTADKLLFVDNAPMGVGVEE